MRRLLAASLALAALGAAGCHYSPGTGAEPPFSSVTVEAVKNDTFAPQMQAELHRQLADSLAQERALHVVPSGGQARLFVTLSEYSRNVSAVNPKDTVQAAAYSLSLSAKIRLVDTRNGKELLRDREVRATLSAYAEDGFLRTETQTLPLLSRELAKQIKDAVTGVW